MLFEPDINLTSRTNAERSTMKFCTGYKGAFSLPEVMETKVKMSRRQVCTLPLNLQLATAGWLLRGIILPHNCFCQVVAGVKSFCHKTVNTITGNRKPQLVQRPAHFFSLKLKKLTVSLFSLDPVIYNRNPVRILDSHS